MAIWKNLFEGLRGLFRKEHAERELDDELQEYLEQSAAEKMHRGMTREQAARAARIEMGGMEVVKENVRAASWETTFETLWTDLRFGARLLRLNPIFAAAAILSLALGIGANTAIFQLLDAVRLRTLPVRNPQELARVAIDQRHRASGSFNGRYSDLTYLMWQQIQGQQQAFAGIFAWSPTTFNTSPSGEVHNVEGLWVSGDFFETLGVSSAAGRLLAQADDQLGCGASGAVISYAYWQHEYGGDSSVLGQRITIARQPFPIIGVTAKGFYGIEPGRYFDVALPLCAEPIVDGSEYARLPRKDDWWLGAMGRLKPGWTIEQASAQLRAVSPNIFEASLPPTLNPEQAKNFLGYKLAAVPAGSGVSELRSQFESPLWMLLALAALVLIIASANLANLLLARATAREKEMGMRMAIGAGRGRLVRQLLMESLLLAAIGAALGAFLARSLSRLLVASLNTQHDPLFMDLGIDWRVLGFMTALAIVTCILFGLAPALRATSVSPGVILKEGARGSTEGASRFGLRRILVVSQIALSLTLLVGALLFARSLGKLASVDAGFQQSGVLVADIDFTALNLSGERRVSFANELLSRARAIPGVDAVAIAQIVPLSGNGKVHEILPGSSEAPTGSGDLIACFNTVSPGFFATLKTPILAGRDFNEHDVAGAPKVAIVNQTFARKILRTSNPVGMTFKVRRLRVVTGPYQIIGLVQNTKYADLREDPPEQIVYTANAQYDSPETDAQLLVRSNMPLADVVSAMKGMTAEVNGNLDVTFSSLHEMIDEGLLRDRLMARLSGFFGALAVLLAVIGLYGVISYMVARRRSEIGIRMTLGASRGSIVSLVLRESLLLLSLGLGVGILLALAGSSAAASLLFGLKPHDPATLAAATLALAVVAVAASYIPALRAAKLGPMDALRHE
jgi:putative ABC transport system permease protein